MAGPAPEQAAPEGAGIVPRTVDLIFAEVEQLRLKGWRFEVRATSLEVYNEVVRDLLGAPPGPTPGGAGTGMGAGTGTRGCGGGVSGGAGRSGWLCAGQPPPPTQPQEAAATGGPGGSASSGGLGGSVGNAAPEFQARRVQSAAAVHALLRRAARERRTAATLCNDRSSRSHTIFQLTLAGRREGTGGQEVQGLLSFVDLAGSERVERSGASGERLREAQHINRSLSALGDVVEALARRRQHQQERPQHFQQGASVSGASGCHVPYRNSRLTTLLKDSLGGESKALMFVNVSPCLRHLGETLSSLRFASKVHACNVGVARRHTSRTEAT